MLKAKPTIPVFYPPKEHFEEVLQLRIEGQPARKSNSRRIVTNRRTGKPMIIKSDAALDYASAFLKQVPGWAKLGLGGPDDPLFLWAVVYYKSNQPDLSVELIKDLLQEAGVIRNDRYIRGELLFGKVSKDDPHTVITIYRLQEGGGDTP